MEMNNRKFLYVFKLILIKIISRENNSSVFIFVTKRNIERELSKP